MKKALFTAVLLLGFSLSNAQFHLGVMAGYNSSLTLSNIGDVTNGTYNLTSVGNEMWNDFHAGLFARIPLGKAVYLEPEVLYAIQKKNYQITIKDAVSNSVTLDKFANISTVDVPILLGVKLLDLKVVNLRAFAGPLLKFNASSINPISFTDPNNQFNTSQLVNDVKAANIGLVVGAGVDVLMFAVDLRYNMISNMYDTKLSTSTLTNLPASTFVISLGWKLF